MKITSMLLPISNRSLNVMCVVVLCVALFGRLGVVVMTPRMDYNIDLCIYVSGGQLISHGINPYDHSDGTEVRQELRLKSAAHCPYIASTQKVWDHFASSNLPLTLMLFGAIDHFFPGNPTAYRVVFAVFDSLLAAFMFLFVFKLWKLKPSPLPLILAASFGLFSPILLVWGTLIPEDKGVQILLMLTALYYARAQKLVLSAILLSGSIAFKGLGVFIAPLCAWYIASRPLRLHELVSRPVVTRLALYTGIILIVTGGCFAVYLPDVILMMTQRLSAELGVSRLPGHASFWLPLSAILPQHWRAVRSVFIAVFVLTNVYCFIRKRIGFEIITASLLLLFVDISLLGGSLDRMHIGVIMALFIVGTCDRSWGLQLGWVYCISSLILMVGYALSALITRWNKEVLDGLFVLGFILYMTILLGIRSTAVKCASPAETASVGSCL